MIDCSHVVDQVYEILQNDKNLTNKFYNKWGVDLIDFKIKITDPLTHGGFISKITSLGNLDVKESMKVLDIGPEMGLEVFMISEFAKKIVICDPDSDNLALISQIASHYSNSSGHQIKDFIEFKPFGLNNSLNFSSDEVNRYKNMVMKFGHSFPTFYNVNSTEPISNLKGSEFDLVFIHKILTTITRSDTKNAFLVFENAIIDIKRILNRGGLCSWTEPEFVWEQKDILNNISKLEDVEIEKIEYKPEGLPEKFIQLLIKNRYQL